MPFVVLTRDAARLIRTSSASTGGIRLRKFDADERFVADQIEVSEGFLVGVRIPREFQALAWGDSSISAQWFRSADAELPMTELYLGRRPGVSVPFDVFHEIFPGVQDPGEKIGLVIVQQTELHPHLNAAGASEFSGWTIARDGVRPFDVQVEPDSYGSIQLQSAEKLQANSITIVGVGSIGGEAAMSIAGLGFGQVHLVDPDRLLWHNIIRHQLGPESVGRFKVDALKSVIEARMRPFDDALSTSVGAHRVDVVEQADELFSLLLKSDVVLCAADGIAPRRVVNHVARLTSTPAVFACVLEDGAIGEILRTRPGTRFGCLMCHRAALNMSGSIDPEALQEIAYGRGTTHKPMSASPSDLRLVGELAAKIAVATVLESRHGESGQHLPDEHMVIGLRPGLPLPPPYDVMHSGQIRWGPVPPPRVDCATCSAA